MKKTGKYVNIVCLSFQVMKEQTVKLTLMSVLSSPVRTVASVLSAQILLTGSWTGSSGFQTQPATSASVREVLQVGKE